MAKVKTRCGWVKLDDPLYCDYHDNEWGVHSTDDRHLFEHLVLDSAQAGLSWITVLRKRENYRSLFANFDAARLAEFSTKDVDDLMTQSGLFETGRRSSQPLITLNALWMCRRNLVHFISTACSLLEGNHNLINDRH